MGTENIIMQLIQKAKIVAIIIVKQVAVQSEFNSVKKSIIKLVETFKPERQH